MLVSKVRKLNAWNVYYLFILYTYDIIPHSILKYHNSGLIAHKIPCASFINTPTRVAVFRNLEIHRYGYCVVSHCKLVCRGNVDTDMHVTHKHLPILHWYISKNYENFTQFFAMGIG